MNVINLDGKQGIDDSDSNKLSSSSIFVMLLERDMNCLTVALMPLSSSVLMDISEW